MIHETNIHIHVHIRETSSHATQMGPVSPWNKGCINYPFHFTNFSSSRCDQLPHCKDLSDEANCQLVILPEGYVLEYPPFSTDDEGLPIKVDVMIKMDLLSISDINEVGQTFTTKFKLSISWSDFRINFHNLKSDQNMNSLTADERQSIWVPKLIFRFEILHLYLFATIIIMAIT